MGADDLSLTIEAPERPFERSLHDKLVAALGSCPDLAFAHLVQARVAGHANPDMVLFVWLLPAAMRSIRMALNLVSDIVARVLPDDRYLDVVILNSAPELLLTVEAAGCLLVEREPEERARALHAAASDDLAPDEALQRRRVSWWPF